MPLGYDLTVNPHAPYLDRFMAKVVILDDGCWEWTGARYRNGYGAFKGPEKVTCAHRIGYELLVGPIPSGLEIDHLCRNRACVNPEHLDPVPHGVNVGRGGNAIKTHCPRGHAYDERNTYRKNSKGKLSRQCRACHAEDERHRRATAHGDVDERTRRPNAEAS